MFRQFRVGGDRHLFFAAVVGGFSLIGLGGLFFSYRRATSSSAQTLPQDKFIQVYFNYRQTKGIEYTDPYREITRSGDNLEAILITEIKAATQTIDIAVQELNLLLVAEAIALQKSEGIKIRIILENNYNRSWATFTETQLFELSQKEQSKYQEFVAIADDNKDGFLNLTETQKYDAINLLKMASIPIIDDTIDGSQGSGLMHHKFMVIDGKKVITGSANWTMSGIHGDFANLETRGNVNHLVVVENEAIATEFTKEFEEMWIEKKFGVQKSQETPKKFTVGDSQVTLQFSPFSRSQPWESTTNGLIGQTLMQANQSIKLALFVFTDQKLADFLETEANQGVTIQSLIDSSFAFREYSSGLDMLGVNLYTECQPFNRPWQNPIQSIGTPKLAHGDKLHHKFAVIDNQTIITGSHNWSAAANHQNDETLLIIQNPKVAAHFQQEFERLYNDAWLGIPAFIEEKRQPIPTDCTLASADGIVNLNTATAIELETLPGIGASLAQRIIEDRPYKNLEDLDRVKGIGEKTIEDLEGKVTW